MNQAEENKADIEFICARIQWYLTQSAEALKEHYSVNRMDGLHYIPNKKCGMLIIGREASGRFEDIVNRFLKGRPAEKQQTNVSEFVRKLQIEFSHRFLDLHHEITEANISAMITMAHKKSTDEFEALKHYIPCALFHSQATKRFAVGPVQFLHATEFSTLHRAEIEGLRQGIAEDHQAHCQAVIRKGFPAIKTATPDQSAELGNHLVDGLLTFFDQYNWFAEVDVPSCEADISYERALSITRSALNVIKLILGRGYTDRLRTAEDRGHSMNSATLYRKANGKLEISLSSSPNDNVCGNDWAKVLVESAPFHFQQACYILTLSAGFNSAPPLCQRFLDALSWYGDAVVEPSPAARIIKLVTAIEAMTGTGPERNTKGEEIRGVTEIVTTRAAIFLQHGTESSMADARKRVSRIYACRSQLVHGSVSPFSDEILPLSHEAEKVTREVLIVGLDYFSSIEIDNPKMTPRELRRKFMELEREKLRADSGIFSATTSAEKESE